MRILVVISSDVYLRSFLSTGAFTELDGHEVLYLAGPVANRHVLERTAGYVGVVSMASRRARLYAELGNLLMFAHRDRSPTFKSKTQTQFLLRDRLRYELFSSPALYPLTAQAIVGLIGKNTDLERWLTSVRPDLIIAPSAVTDPLLIDVARTARRLSVPTFFLINGWDNLSSKLVFPVKPDYLGVWGPQTAEHATRIHGFAPAQIFTLGVPTFEAYFRVDRSHLPRPYPFRYVVFAGCSMPFDDIGALQALDAALAAQGVDDLKIVYRPHPWRQRRRCFDVFEPRAYRHVLIDRQVETSYFESVRTGQCAGPRTFLPSLDYYPALLHHAAFVICPLSTMLLEAAIFDRPVLIPAYDDGVHRPSHDRMIHDEHFKGLDRIEGFRLCRDAAALPAQFLEMAERDPTIAAGPSLREQIRHYLYYDDRTYAQRLRDAVESLAQGRPRSPHVSPPVAVGTG